MDLNLHLLGPDQLKLIQDICLTKGDLYGHKFTGFAEVRDKIDLIILDRTTGYGKYENFLNEREEKIRERIEQEKKRRENGEMPDLPNYDSGIDEPIWPNEDDIQLDPIIEDFINWKPGSGMRPSLDCILDAIDKAHSPTRIGYMSDFELIRLDLGLARIKWNRLRLQRNALLGCYTFETDNPDSTKKVILFIDAIVDCAHSSGVSINDVVADVFVHEMFHAYFDDTKAQPFIFNYLRGVNEVEEAVTECATLMFISQFYSHYLSFAERDVKAKFASTYTGIHCYGVGYYLYEELKTLQPIKNILKKFTKIERSLNQTNCLVWKYLIHTYSLTPNARRCVNMLLAIIEYYDKRIQADMKHLAFNKIQYGWSSKIAYAVLNYYVSYNSPVTYADMKTDFGPGYADFFELTVNATPENYDFDNPIVLNPTETVVPKLKWKNKKTDNTQRLIEVVKDIYRKGRIDQIIDPLR